MTASPVGLKVSHNKESFRLPTAITIGRSKPSRRLVVFTQEIGLDPASGELSQEFEAQVRHRQEARGGQARGGSLANAVKCTLF